MEPDVSNPSTSAAVVMDREQRAEATTWFHKRAFRFLREDEVEREATRLINALGRVGDAMFIHAMLDDMLQLLSASQTSPALRAGASAVLLEFLRGRHPSFRETFPHIVDHVLSSDLWTSPPPPDILSKEDGRLSVEVLRCDEWTVAVFIECIDCMSESCPTAFEGLLMRVLFPLLEKSGESRDRISRAAIACLHRLAKHHTQARVEEDCGQSERLQKLLSENMDYLIDTIVARLSYLKQYPNTPLVLSALLTFAGVNALPLLKDGMWAVLQSLDANAGDIFRSLELLKVTKSMVASCRPLLLPDANISKPPPTEQPAPLSSGTDSSAFTTKDGFDSPLARLADDLKQFRDSQLFETTMLNPLTSFEEVRYTFLNQDYVQRMSNVDADADASVDEPRDSNDPNMDMDHTGLAVKHGVDPGEHNKMMLRIITRCSHFISSPNLKVRVLALDCCGQSLEILKDTNARAQTNDLLPNIHLMWPALISSLERHQAMPGKRQDSRKRQLRAEVFSGGGDDDDDDDTSHENLALMASLNLVTVVCKVAGEFVARRFSGVWNILRSHLRRTRRQLQAEKRAESTLVTRMAPWNAKQSRLTMHDLHSIATRHDATEQPLSTTSSNVLASAHDRRTRNKQHRAWTSMPVRLRASIFKALVLVARCDGGKSALAGAVAQELSIEAYWHLWQVRGMKGLNLEHRANESISTQSDVVVLAYILYKELLCVDVDALWWQTCILTNKQAQHPPIPSVRALTVEPQRKKSQRRVEDAFLPWMEPESDLEEIIADENDGSPHHKVSISSNADNCLAHSLIAHMDAI
jgi:hypothetical protein